MIWKSVNNWIAIIIVGWVLSASLAYLAWDNENKIRVQAFTSDVKFIREAIKQTIENNVLQLSSVGSYFDAEFGITRSKFERFTLDTVEQSDGIQAFEWVPRVKGEDREKMESIAQFSGVSDFEFKERNPWGELIPAGDRAEYYPVYFAEPLYRNTTVLGFDLGSNPERKAALEHARDTGKITFSAPISLIQGDTRQSATLALRPVYRRDRPAVDIEGRRNNLVGFAMAVLRIGDMLGAANYDRSRNIGFNVFDRLAEKDNQLLYQSSDSNAERPDELTSRRLTLELDVYPRKWEIVFSPTPKHELNAFNFVPLMIFFAGGVVFSLLSWLVHSLQGRQTYAEELVRLQTKDLEVARAKAERAAVAKSEFLASMSHEIRTPMVGIMGFADILLAENIRESTREKIGKIKSSATSLLTILNDILDLSKLDAGKLDVEKINFRPASIVDDTAQLFRQTCPPEKKDKLTISIEFADDFPDAVCADPTRLRQVLVNLMGNAVKFTDAGTITLSCFADTEKSMLRFEIIDTGIGIDAETQEKLFGDFVQADASISRKYHGTGLGLSICKRLVELMGGAIGIESELGVGSTFWFTLPYDAVADDAIILEDRSSMPTRYSSSRQLKILVAEDNEINQTVIEALLDNMGHSFVFADNGLEAVEAVQLADFDLVLMDVRMPELSGPDATREIRKLPGFKGAIPIIALTADVMAENRQSYFDAGMNDCVGKPVKIEELALAMNKALGETVNMPLDDDAAPAPAPVAVEPTLPAFDLAEVKARLGLPESVLISLLQKFASTYSDVAERATRHLEAEEFIEVADLAHSVKGASGSLGLTFVSEAAGDLEKSSREHDVKAAEAALNKFALATAAAIRQINVEFPETTPEATA